jgi:hypothetical protein
MRVLLAAACAATAGLLVGCGSSHAQTSTTGASSSGAPAASPAPTIGLIRAPRGLTDRLVLQQRHVAAGTSIKGTLLVTYRGHAPINLDRGCRPQYAVVVTNRRFPPAAAFASVCFRTPFIIKPGENRLSFTVFTTFLQCSEVASQATSGSPACRPRPHAMPPLAPGRYQAVLVGDGLPLPAPTPIPVLLAPAG